MGSLHQGEEESRRAQDAAGSPHDATRLLSTFGTLFPIPQAMFPSHLPAGITTPLWHKRLLCAHELFNTTGPGRQAAVSESALRALPRQQRQQQHTLPGLRSFQGCVFPLPTTPSAFSTLYLIPAEKGRKA